MSSSLSSPSGVAIEQQQEPVASGWSSADSKGDSPDWHDKIVVGGKAFGFLIPAVR
jgi:hypothetical protein